MKRTRYSEILEAWKHRQYRIDAIDKELQALISTGMGLGEACLFLRNEILARNSEEQNIE